MTGGFQDTVIFGRGTHQASVTASPNTTFFFLARYDSEGNLVWVKQAGLKDGENTYYGNMCLGESLAVLPDGSALVAGDFEGTSVFGKGEPHETTLVTHDVNNTGYHLSQGDVFYARFNPDGTLAWARQISGTGTDRGKLVASPDGSFWIGGQLSDATVFGAGETTQTTLYTGNQFSEDVYLARYNSDGHLLWVSRSTGTMNGRHNSANDLTILPDNSVLMVGRIGSDTTFGKDESGQTQISSPGGIWTNFIVKYRPDGSLSWAKRLAIPSTYYSASGRVIAMPNGSYRVVCAYTGTTSFMPDSPAPLTLTATGGPTFNIVAFKADDSFDWTRKIAGSHGAIPTTLALLDDGSLAITGGYSPSTMCETGTGSVKALLGHGSDANKDILLLIYSPEGILKWAGGFGRKDDETGDSLSANGSSIWLTGSYYTSANPFSTEDGSAINFQSHGGYQEMFLTRYSTMPPPPAIRNWQAY